MSYKLTNKDYTNIMKFYKLKIPKSKRILKMQAEEIIAKKLCRCIKKLEPKYKEASIGICTKNVLNSKGLTRGKFSCDKKAKITLKKINKKNKTLRNKRN